ncbi:MAG: hypothetical protein ACOY40_00970 [Bacillota bacterium]
MPNKDDVVKAPYSQFKFTTKGAILTSVIALAYIGTWLPHFGIFNSLVWIGPFTLPMLWILALNIVTTLGVLAIYKFYFKPFFEKYENSHQPL